MTGQIEVLERANIEADLMVKVNGYEADFALAGM